MKMRTMMKKRRSSKRMENPHKDQLKIKSSKLYQITSKKKKATKQMDLGTMHHSFCKKN
jgi:CO dehydrogenase nickel-insertion accessory protein CooC1